MAPILVLEETPVKGFVQSALNSYTIIHAHSAVQALEQFKENRRTIGLLISRVHLSISSGIQVALLLRTVRPHLPVILTSDRPAMLWSRGDLADLTRLEANKVRMLEEPVDSELIVSVVGKLIGPSQYHHARTA